MRSSILFLLVFLLLAAIPYASGQTGTGADQYEISPDNDHVTVNLNTQLFQNLTQMPVTSYVLQGQNSSRLASALTMSIQGANHDALVQAVVLKYSSNGTLIHLILSFEVRGVLSSDPWGDHKLDTSWRSFQVSDDLRFGGAALNLVGKNYLSGPLLTFADQAEHPRSQFRISFKVNGHTAIFSRIRQLAPNLNLLNFSSAEASLDTWQRDFKLFPASTAYTQDVGFDVQVKVTVTEPTGELLTSTDLATYKVKALIEVPGMAQILGDEIIFGPNILELVFGGIVIAAVILTVGTYLAEKRLTSSRRSKPKKR